MARVWRLVQSCQVATLVVSSLPPPAIKNGTSPISFQTIFTNKQQLPLDL
jgi:hypothetical protein